MRKLSELEKERRDDLRAKAQTAFSGSCQAAQKPPGQASLESSGSASDTDDPVLAAYGRYIAGKRAAARDTLRQIELEEAYEAWLLAAAQQKSRALSVNGEKRSTPQSRKHAARLAALRQKKEALCASDPDFFCVCRETDLAEDLAEERAGRLVGVPYLLRAKKQIADSLNAGIPVYLVGHLGSGKTQLAIECAVDYMRENLLWEQLTKRMYSECGGLRKSSSSDPAAQTVKSAAGSTAKSADSPEYSDLFRFPDLPDTPETFKKFCTIYPEVKAEVDRADLHPYFIAGSHNLTAEDMFFEKTLKLSHSEGRESNEAQLEQLIHGFMDFIRQNESIMADMTQDQRLELMLAGWKTFSGMYIAENSGYGTTVEKIEKEVLKALKEGKPVIIDEINTIAMANLIALNDILQHHAGQTAYITGIGSLTIHPGFCLIGTGNLSTGTVSYEGTNTLNPAFQSRFTTVVYNYVPQTESGDLNRDADPSQNELFRLLLGHLCNADGTLSLPDPAQTIPALWHLAQMARVSQDIFEGRTEIPGNPDNGTGTDSPVLSEAVLSIRGLIHVLDRWNYGEDEDLSMALWDGFLSSVTNADDRNLLLALAARYGFFPESGGWHVEARARGSAPLTYDDIRTAPYRHRILPMQTLSREDVIALLFGDGPKRTEIDADLGDRILIDEAAGRNLDLALSLGDSLRELEHSAALLDCITAEGDDVVKGGSAADRTGAGESANRPDGSGTRKGDDVAGDSSAGESRDPS